MLNLIFTGGLIIQRFTCRKHLLIIWGMLWSLLSISLLGHITLYRRKLLILCHRGLFFWGFLQSLLFVLLLFLILDSILLSIFWKLGVFHPVFLGLLSLTKFFRFRNCLEINSMSEWGDFHLAELHEFNDFSYSVFLLIKTTGFDYESKSIFL